VTVDLDGLLLPVLGRAQLIANKRAAGRPKDLRDVEALEHFGPGRSKLPKAKKARKQRRRG
jgi:hypothetical protein